MSPQTPAGFADTRDTFKWEGSVGVATMDSMGSLRGRLYERWAGLDRGWRAACLGTVIVLAHVAV